MADKEKLGEWAFIVGVIIAIVIGLFSGNIEGTQAAGWLSLLLVVLGLVVGFLNISDKETTAFLVAAIALLVPGIANSTFSNIDVVGGYLSGIVSQLTAFVAPAAIVVALKAIYTLASKA